MENWDTNEASLLIENTEGLYLLAQDLVEGGDYADPTSVDMSEDLAYELSKVFGDGEMLPGVNTGLVNWQEIAEDLIASERERLLSDL